MKYAQLITEITNRIAKMSDHEKATIGTPEHQAMWFTAYHEAVGLCEQNRAKDWAHMLMDGVPKMSQREVENWLESMEDDDTYCTEESEKSDYFLIQMLDSFYGDRQPRYKQN